MELSNILSKIKKLGFEKAVFYLNIQSEDEELDVHQIASENQQLIAELADELERDYHKMYDVTRDTCGQETYYIHF